MKVDENDLVVTVGTTGTGGCPQPGQSIHAIKVYVARVRKKDKVLIWKLYETLDPVANWGPFPPPKLIKLGRTYAKERGIPFVLDIKNNDPVDYKPVRKPKGSKSKVKAPSPVQPSEPQAIGRFRRFVGDDWDVV